MRGRRADRLAVLLALAGLAGCGTAATPKPITGPHAAHSRPVVNCAATLAQIRRTARRHPESLTPAARRALKLLARGRPDPALCASGTDVITRP